MPSLVRKIWLSLFSERGCEPGCVKIPGRGIWKQWSHKWRSLQKCSKLLLSRILFSSIFNRNQPKAPRSLHLNKPPASRLQYWIQMLGDLGLFWVPMKAPPDSQQLLHINGQWHFVPHLLSLHAVNISQMLGTATEN